MNKTHSALIAMSIAAFPTLTLASIPTFDDLGIYAPCDDAQVEIIWMGSSTPLSGELDWINPDLPGSPLTLFSSNTVAAGQSVILPGLFALGERIDFSYLVTGDLPDHFSTAEQSDWGQFVIDDSDPLDILVSIDDTRFPNKDADFNDAVFRVVFSHPVPTPGSMALLGTGGLFMIRRRR